MLEVDNTTLHYITFYVHAHLLYKATHAQYTSRTSSGVQGAGCPHFYNTSALLCSISVSGYDVIVGYILYIQPLWCLSYTIGPSPCIPHICGDTHLGGSSSLYQAPNQAESSPQVREVRRKKRVVLQRCRGLGLYMVRGSTTVLFLRETHTCSWRQGWIWLTERAAPNFIYIRQSLSSCSVRPWGCIFNSD